MAAETERGDGELRIEDVLIVHENKSRERKNDGIK